MNNGYKSGYQDGQKEALLELGRKLRAMSEPLFQKLMKEQKFSDSDDIRLEVLNEIADWEKEMLEAVIND